MRSILTMLLLTAVGAAQAQPIQLPQRPSERPQLKSIYAGTHEITEFVRDDTKVLVVWFTGLDCPVAQQYVPTMKELYATYKDQGVQILAVYPNARVDIMSMAVHAQDQDFPFPVLKDMDHRLADVLDAQRTPEVVVLDAKLNKRYQGAIDSQFTKRGRTREASREYLKDAIAKVLAGETVDRAYVPASGCPIERLGRPTLNRQVNFHRDVEPILQKNCQACHRPGGVGPFELMTYEDAYYSAERIAEVVGERRMPPWHGRLNGKFGELHNDKRLSEQEILTITGWVDQGAKPGDAKDAPQPIQWPDPNAWAIGKPDYVYKMPEPFKVPKTGILDYQFFRVPLGFKEDRWFRGVEIKPGAVDVVHHVALHLVPSGNKKFVGFTGMAELYGFTAEKARLINDYVPGDSYNAKVYPPDQAVRIPKGYDLIYEVHYTPNNRSEVLDQSEVAFQWADKPPREEVLTEVFRKPVGRFRIPPHESHVPMVDSYYFKQDVLVDAIRPHFHYRGKSFRLEIVQRDPDTDEITHRETVLSVPIWDPDWQRTYELKKPLLVRAGTELLATAHFDNSWLNPNNPDPSSTVVWGQQTNDEMFSTRFKVRRVDASGGDAPAERTVQAN